MKNPSIAFCGLNVAALRKTVCILAPLFVCATLSHAALLLQENFNSLTTGDLNGQNSWTADAGVTVTAGGLSYNAGSINIAGGANRVESNLLSTGTTPIATRSFSSQSGDVWFSFTLLVDSSVNDSRYWFWVSDTTSINTGVTAAVSDNNTGNSNLLSEFRVNTSTSSSSAGGVVQDQVYFVVGRLSKDGSATNVNAYDLMELWVNPTSTTLTGGLIANGPAANSITGGISNFGLTTLSTAADLQWDNLLVGTSQADVLDVYAIPEPSTYAAFGGLAALGLATLRRRRG